MDLSLPALNSNTFKFFSRPMHTVKSTIISSIIFDNCTLAYILRDDPYLHEPRCKGCRSGRRHVDDERIETELSQRRHVEVVTDTDDGS